MCKGSLKVACWWIAIWAIGFLARAGAVEHEELLRKLTSGDPRLAREAAEAVQKATPKEREELLAIAEGVKTALSSTRDSAAERELRLALGKLAAAGVEDAAEWGFESMSVTHSAKTPPEVFEAHARALEMVPGAAKELMIGNLDVALNFPDAEPKERQRLKEFVTLTAEAMRTRELAEFLDALLTGEEDLFVKIEAPLEARLLACYQKVKVEPRINADAVVTWIEKHPGGPAEVEIAALETISLVGTTKTDAAAKLAERLLAKPENAVVIGRRLVAGHLDKSLLPQVKEALGRHAAADQSGQVKVVLGELRKLAP
jgi:hypothetical protein